MVTPLQQENLELKIGVQFSTKSMPILTFNTSGRKYVKEATFQNCLKLDS